MAAPSAPYEDAPFQSTDQQIWCADTFDLSTFPTTNPNRLLSAKPIWVNPYSALPAFGTKNYDPATGLALATTSLQVAKLLKIFVWIETTLAFASGAFQLQWGILSAVLAGSNVNLDAFNDLTLVSTTPRGTLIEIDNASFDGRVGGPIYQADLGIVISASWDGVGAGGTGKIKTGVIVSQSAIT